ncbi:MAG: beta-ketoacyl-[acyl-carrier-protein] synthase family protein [Pirellulales bacterium]|nr:beta-ketoacyl-[acyl-carrier-protein] synthase family protein [Pirellulales bacterium]
MSSDRDRVVITGIGLITSVGRCRESTWRAVQLGHSGVRRIHNVPEIPDGRILGATVDLSMDEPWQLKNVPLSLKAAEEAITDAGIRLRSIDRDRFGCFISGHMGNTNLVAQRLGRRDLIPAPRSSWYSQWLPNSASTAVIRRFRLTGPTSSHISACATSTVDFLSAVRAIRDHQCDIAITGAAEVIHPIFAAGFQNMGALADHVDPKQACRPFDINRNGFVMGEGAGALVIERLDHARRRGAIIYAEVLGGCMLADAHHLTGIDMQSNTLVRLILQTLRRSDLIPSDIDYISAHGTGTQQNDVAESHGIRRSLGRAAEHVCVSSIKSMIGHLVNASGCTEIAITALALRDGFAPPTINLTHPDPACDLDCIPLVGRRYPVEHALKLSLAFGGHMAAVALRRWDQLGDARQALPLARAA